MFFILEVKPQSAVKALSFGDASKAFGGNQKGIDNNQNEIIAIQLKYQKELEKFANCDKSPTAHRSSMPTALTSSLQK